MDKICQDFLTHLKVNGYNSRYEIIFNSFINHCLNNNINYLLLSLSDLNTYLLLLKNKNYSNGTINIELNAIRCFYRFLMLNNHITEDLYDKQIKKMPLLRVETKVKTYLTYKEIKDIVELGEAFVYHMSPLKIRALLWLWFYTGLRPSEMIALRRIDVDLKAMKLLVRIPNKTKTERYAYFNKFVKVRLEEFFNYEAEKYNAFNINVKKLQVLFKALKDFCPGKNINGMVMRHSFAHYLVLKNVNMRTAQKLLGHKELDNTAVYYDPNDIEVEKTYRELLK